jgi:copper homeostasis protein
VLVEACIDSVASARAAQAGGAGRLELCDNLADGGTTPSTGMLTTVRDAVDLPLFVIVRPRGGGFVYDEDEIEVMRRDIDVTKAHGADGIVLGVLSSDGAIDRELLSRLVEDASPLPVTFHRAFDFTVNLDEALETLIACGVERVLTSGGAPTARDGADAIADLVRRADHRIRIMAGGGLREDHVTELVRRTGVSEIHVRGATPRLDQGFTSNNRFIRLRKQLPDNEFAFDMTDEKRIREFVLRATQRSAPNVND